MLEMTQARIRGPGNIRAIQQPLIAQRLRPGSITVQRDIATAVSREADGRVQDDRAAVVRQGEAVIGRRRNGDGKQIGQRGRRDCFAVSIVAPGHDRPIGAKREDLECWRECSPWRSP